MVTISVALNKNTLPAGRTGIPFLVLDCIFSTMGRIYMIEQNLQQRLMFCLPGPARVPRPFLRNSERVLICPRMPKLIVLQRGSDVLG